MYSTVCKVQYVEYSMYSIVSTVEYVQYTMYSIVSTVQYVQHSMYSTICTVQYAQYSMYSTVCTLQYVQYSMYSAVCTVQYVQQSTVCTVHHSLFYRTYCSFHRIYITNNNCNFNLMHRFSLTVKINSIYYSVTVNRCCSYSCFVLLKMGDNDTRNMQSNRQIKYCNMCILLGLLYQNIRKKLTICLLLGCKVFAKT